MEFISNLKDTLEEGGSREEVSVPKGEKPLQGLPSPSRHMRHNVAGKKLNRDIKERKSLFKNLASSLVDRGRIVTTEAKAKALKPLIDKLVGIAKKGTLASKRQLLGFFGRREVVDKLEKTVAPSFKDRASGFTRIVKKGERLGDGAKEAVMEWVEKIEEAPKVITTPTKTAKLEKETGLKESQKTNK